MKPRTCNRGACRERVEGEAMQCATHLAQAQVRARNSYRRRRGIPLDAPLARQGRMRESVRVALGLAG